MVPSCCSAALITSCSPPMLTPPVVISRSARGQLVLDGEQRLVGLVRDDGLPVGVWQPASRAAAAIMKLLESGSGRG